MGGVEKVNAQKTPEYNSWYLIRQLATKRVLDSNAKGQVYTKVATKSNYQQWRPIKTQRGEILLINRATNRFPDGDGNRLYTNAGHEESNHYKVWNVSQGWTRKRPENIRYFKAKTNDAWTQSYPSGKNSNASWDYLGENNMLLPSACIGW